MSSLEDKQAELSDIRAILEGMLADLDSAESCETEKDFHANVLSLKDGLRDLTSEIEEALS